MDDRVFKALEHTHIRGAMSPVKLIASHDGCLSVFLDTGLPSSRLRVPPAWVDQTLAWMAHAYKKFRVRLKVFQNQPFVIGMYSL